MTALRGPNPGNLSVVNLNRQDVFRVLSNGASLRTLPLMIRPHVVGVLGGHEDDAVAGRLSIYPVQMRIEVAAPQIAVSNSQE